jgi:hypothetical protein
MPHATHTVEKPDVNAGTPCSVCGGDTNGGVCIDTTCIIHAQ